VRSRARRRRLALVAAALILLAGWPAPALAADRIVIEAGAGHEGELLRLGLQCGLGRRDLGGGGWRVEALLEASLGAWQPELGDRGLYDLGVTPVLRLAPEALGSRVIRPFLEAGLGAHLLSNVSFSDLDLSTSFQFGSHLGLGVLLGGDGRWSLTYRFQHLSNASVKLPNPGIEFHILQLGLRFTNRG
jgi:hypothetical protein